MSGPWLELYQVFGYLNILCWPTHERACSQLWENYRRKSGEGISVLFLVIWLVGDVFSIIGLILSKLLNLQLVLALYYTVVDALLIAQIYYYRVTNPAFVGEEEETQTLIPADELVDNDDDDTSKFGSSSSSDVTRLNTFSPWLYLAVAFTVKHVGAMVIKAAVPSMADEVDDVVLSVMNAGGGASEDVTGARLIAALFFGYSSAVLYIGSRIPQIVQNFQTKSCEGLSPLLFVFSVLGNLAYLVQVQFEAMYKGDGFGEDYYKHMNTNIPYLLGSGGTLIFDFTIFLQFYMYARKQEPSYTKI